MLVGAVKRFKLVPVYVLALNTRVLYEDSRLSEDTSMRLDQGLN